MLERTRSYCRSWVRLSEDHGCPIMDRKRPLTESSLQRLNRIAIECGHPVKFAVRDAEEDGTNGTTMKTK